MGQLAAALPQAPRPANDPLRSVTSIGNPQETARDRSERCAIRRGPAKASGIRTVPTPNLSPPDPGLGRFEMFFECPHCSTPSPRSTGVPRLKPINHGPSRARDNQLSRRQTSHVTVARIASKTAVASPKTANARAEARASTEGLKSDQAASQAISTEYSVGTPLMMTV